MRLREMPVQKHIHKWVLTKRLNPSTSPWDLVYVPWTVLTRKCDDCGLQQIAECRRPNDLVPGYEALADLQWS